MIVKLQI